MHLRCFIITLYYLQNIELRPAYPAGVLTDYRKWANVDEDKVIVTFLGIGKNSGE